MKLRDHRVPAPAVLLATLAALTAACPAAQSTTETPATTTTTTETAHDTSLADAIVADWEQLLAQARAIYVGTWSTETGADGFNSFCVTPVRAVHGPTLDLPGKICTPSGSVVGGPHGGYPWPSPGDMAWVVTARPGGGAETILTAAPDDCDGSQGCDEPPRDALVQNLRCGQLAALWYDLPEVDTRCDADDDCVVLTAMCFEASVRADAAPPYQEVLLRFGGVCLNPAAGACPRFPVRTECRDGRCTPVR
jgi:hypothetical protein